MKKFESISQLASHNALQQSIIAVLLIAVIPSLSLYHIGSLMFLKADQASPYIPVFIFSMMMIIASAGFVMLLKFPKNIIQLRQHIADLAEGVLPEKINLIDTQNSDDLMFIENGLNIILQEMHHRIELVEEKLRVEHTLRETIERQQHNLLQAERHRAMVQSLGAACHHIGQPAAILKMRLCLIKQIVGSEDEVAEIEECERDLRLILIVLDKLRAVNEFRTESFVDDDGCEILAI
jgi:hypothetical protein